MKKGLFSILAGALLVVGCQNYDDQFSNIESQITALASQVAGLSQVQSDLSSLANQVTSLQSSVGDTVDAALADGLADIATAAAALTAASATAASSEAVQELADAVNANQLDLTELLEQSSVYSGDVVVNSESTLDAFFSMGKALNIVNGSVNITATAAMDSIKVQGLVDNILTVIKDFKYTAAASTIKEVTFNNLTGVQTMTLKQGGGYKAQGLLSAEKIILSDAWKSTVTIIDFRAMKSVGSLMTTATANTIDFNKATEIHLTVLERYGAALTLKGAKNGVIALGALKDVDASGLVSKLDLTIDGPAAMTIAGLDGKLGSITASNIGALVVNSYNGKIVVGADVTSFSTDGVYSIAGSTFADTETVVMAGKLDPNAIGTTAAPLEGPSFSYTSNTDLENVTISGVMKAVNMSNQSSLISAIISADISGAITLGTNSDLTTITLTGSKATGVTITACDDLATLTVDTTMRGIATKLTTINGTVAVTSNTDLTALTVSSNKVRTLSVTGNTDLETIDMTGMAATGSTAKAAVNVYSNKLVATVSQDTAEAVGATVTAGTATDLGAFTTTSGMATLKLYLAAVVADTGSIAAVHFDTIDSVTNSAGAEQLSNQTYAITPLTTRVLSLTAGSGDGVAAKGEIAASRAWLVDITTPNALQLFNAAIPGGHATPGMFAGTTASSMASFTANSNADLTIADIKSAANIARFAAYNMTLDAYKMGNNTVTVSFTRYGSGVSGNQTGTIIGERYTSTTANTAAVSATNYGFGADDYVTVTVGTNTATATGATVLALGAAMKTAWDAKYTTGGTASATAIASVVNTAGSLVFTMLDKGSSQYNKAVTVGFTAGTVTASNGKNMDVRIGATLAGSDNVTNGTTVVLKLTSIPKGVALNALAAIATSGTDGDLIELFSTEMTNVADATGAFIERAEARSDVKLPENGLGAVAATTAAVSYSRLGWL